MCFLPSNILSHIDMCISACMNMFAVMWKIQYHDATQRILFKYHIFEKFSPQFFIFKNYMETNEDGDGRSEITNESCCFHMYDMVYSRNCAFSCEILVWSG